MRLPLPALAALAAPALLLALGLTACGDGTDVDEPATAPATGSGSAAEVGAEAPSDAPVPEATAGDATSGPVPIPMPDLSAAEPGVRRQLGERYEAVESLRREGAPDGELAEAYGELATAFMAYEFADAADAALTNAHRLAPEDFRWAYLLGYRHQLRGRLDSAARLLERARELRPDYVPAMIRLGRLRLDTGEVEAARRLFERALELEPGSVPALEGLGRAATASGDHAAAVRYFRKALERQPEASSLRYYLGQALRRTGDLEAAREQLARAGDAPVLIPDPLVDAIARTAESAQFYIVQGGEALADRRFEAAASAFARAVEIAPDNFVARKGMGYTLEKLGDLAGAEEQIRHALDAAGGDAEEAEARAILGSLAITAGDDRTALEELRRSLALDPDQPGTRIKLADTLARLGRMEEAVAQYDRLLAADPESPGALRIRRATALVNLGRGEEAVAEFRRAVEADPGSASLRLRFAEALDYLGRGEEAAEQRRIAEELSSAEGDRVALLAGEGRLRTGRGDFEGAAESYRRALELAPERHDVRTALAAVLGHMGRYEEALAEYRRVVEAEPDHAGARRGEIAALILSGRYGLARVRLNEALRRFSRDRELALTQARLLAAAPDPRVRDGALALEVAQRVRRIDGSPGVLDTLAMALAESGRVEEAAELQRRVVAEAESRGAGELAERLRRRLATYERGRAWHADPAEAGVLLAFGPPA